MRLFEYEAKAIFKEAGIPIPDGDIATDPEQAAEVAMRVGFPVVMKAQVLVGGRGKAGGIRYAENVDQVKGDFTRLQALTIKGEKVEIVRVEQKLPVKTEYYVGVALNRSKRCFTLMASPAGGVGIEETAAVSPELIAKLDVDLLHGFQPFHARNLAKSIGLTGSNISTCATIIKALYDVLVKYDAELTEINPLILTSNDRFYAADARLLIDDSALYRHKEIAKLLELRQGELNPRELLAARKGFSYVELEGDVGVMGNGAGLVMATLDLVKGLGGEPSDFLDIGGGASAEVVNEALSLLLDNPKVRAVFVNILGGITRCDEVAKGIVAACRERKNRPPMVVRLEGNFVEEGKGILAKAGIETVASMDDAAQRAVALSGE